jgi:flagellar hook-length control protein FliK
MVAKANSNPQASHVHSSQTSHWAKENKSGMAGLGSAQNFNASEHLQTDANNAQAYARLAEMQAQAKTMLLLSKGASNAGLISEGESLGANTHPPIQLAVWARASQTSGDPHEQDASKKTSSADSEVLTALGIARAEQHQRQGQDGSHDAQADPEFDSITKNTLQSQIHAAFGSLQWCEEIGQKLIYMSGANMFTAVLNLNPLDLGPLKIIITVKDRLVDSTFISNHSAVRQSLQDNLDQLRNSMGHAGLELGQVDIRSSLDFQQSQAQATAALKSEHQEELENVGSELSEEVYL